jgi:hypothetical protein
MDVSIEENLDTTDKRELGDFLVALQFDKIDANRNAFIDICVV